MKRILNLATDDDGSAIAELVVLIPLYLTLIGGAFYLGDLTMAKQEVVEASRYFAWGPDEASHANNEKVRQAFFSRFPGQARMESRERNFSHGMAGLVYDMMRIGAENGDLPIISRLLNNFNDEWLKVSEATVRFEYRPEWYSLAGVAPLHTVECDNSVMLRTGKEYPKFREGTHYHPIEELTMLAGRPFHPARDRYFRRDVLEEGPDMFGLTPWNLRWCSWRKPSKATN